MTLTIITPPDYYHRSQTKSLILNPTDDEKKIISDFLKSNDVTDVSIYLYNNDNNVDWLLNVVQNIDSAYINVDNSKDLSYYYLSYLVSQSKVTWNSSKVDYSIINREKVRSVNEFIQRFWLV